MKKLFVLLILCTSLFAGLPASADFDEGWRAYHKGDYAFALREFRILAEQGNAKAQYALGEMYYGGHGVLQDFQEAIKWTRLAAEQKNASAQHNLGVFYSNEAGVPRDYVFAHMWFNISALNGSAYGAEERDDVAKLMTPEQITKAQEMARECVAKDYQGC